MISPAVVGLVKLGAGFVVSSGVSTMVGFAAKSSVPKVAPHIIRNIPALAKGFHIFQKVAIPAGAVALAGLASEQAVAYAERRIDENVKAANEMEAVINATSEMAKQKKAAKKAAKAEPEAAE